VVRCGAREIRNSKVTIGRKINVKAGVMRTYENRELLIFAKIEA
jgi:hypothetical protein